MKKRSLFAAVAMLIVSAIVLTSATYAWFSSNTNAYMTAFSSNVSNSDGSIMLSADGGTNWLTTIAEGNFTNTTLQKCSAFTPVDCDARTTTPTFVGGTLANGTWTKDASAATAGTHYTEFTFKVKTTVDVATVTCTPAFSTAAAFGYAAVIVDGHIYVYGSEANRTYNCFQSSITSANDTNGNDIIDSGDTSCPTLNQVTATNPGTITFSTTANTPVDVRVLVWAEGQDEACTGSVQPSAIGIGFTFSK